ncbi:MAG: SnoaL-like domain-containing protein, partial [Opitutaceae bacterium]
EVRLGEDVLLRFRRVPAGAYIDGIRPELKERVLSVPNRRDDMRRWEGMFESDRRDRVSVPCDFFMSETIVSNAMFACFVRATGYKTAVSRHETGWVVDANAQWLQGFANEWRQQLPPLSEPDHPVVQVIWFDAMAFAAWLSGRNGVTFKNVMTTKQIAERLVALCRKGEFETAQKELFAQDAVSIEPYATPDFPQETKGLPAIIKKGHQFESMVEETHSSEVSDPIVADNSFACAMRMDVTMKDKGRMEMKELCVYIVKDGKITSEQFHMQAVVSSNREPAA